MPAEGSGEVVNYEARPSFVDGIPVVSHFNERLVREALSYEPRSGDVILATFPKTGTTWCQYLIWGIHNLGSVEAGSLPSVEDMLTKEFPYIELLGTSSTIAERNPPRFIKSHLPPEVIHRPHSAAKFVSCLRNPFDVAVSYFHMRYGRRHLTGLPPEYGFDHFLEELLTGGLVGGDYFHHSRSWYERGKKHDNVLVFFYEELKEQPGKVVLQLAEFLNPDAASRLRAEPGLLDRLLQQTSLNNLRRLTGVESYVEGDFSLLHPTAALFRKGVVGGWRSFFTKDQERRFRDAYEEALGGTELYDFWAKHIKSEA